MAADRAAVQSAQVALGYADACARRSRGASARSTSIRARWCSPTLSLVTITQLDPIAVSFPVPEANLQDLLAAAARTCARASRPWCTGRKDAAAWARSTSSTTRSIRRSAPCAPRPCSTTRDQSLWPGQFVGTRITVRTLKGATVVPAAALMMLPDGTSLYVVDEATHRRAAAR